MNTRTHAQTHACTRTHARTHAQTRTLRTHEEELRKKWWWGRGWGGMGGGVEKDPYTIIGNDVLC